MRLDDGDNFGPAAKAKTHFATWGVFVFEQKRGGHVLCGCGIQLDV
jgi:hypothetical protein